MRGAGKKTKKNKGTVLSLNTFLGDAPQGTVNVVKKLSNNVGEYSDDDDSNTTAVVVQLPTAPKAKRVFDDDAIPHKPPFLVRISNLPFDADEDDVCDLFGEIAVKSVNLPRDDGETGRLRGFGKVELENREDLIHMLSLPEPTIRGRRIRIELFNQAEYAGGRMGAGAAAAGDDGNRRRYNNFGDTDANRESTNWRQDSNMGAASNWASRERDSSGSRDQKAWRRNSPEAGTSRNTNWTQRTYRDAAYDKVASNWRQESGDRNSERGGSWRTSANSSKPSDFSAWRDKDEGNRRRNYGNKFDRSPPRDQRQWQRRNSPDDEYGQGRTAALNDDERPRLKLLPRQLPLPTIITSGEAASKENSTLNQAVQDCEIKTNFTANTLTVADPDSGHDSDDVAVADEAV